MSLVPVSEKELSASELLPFDIFDSRGRLLLRAECKPSERTLQGYLRQGIYTTDTQFAAWKRRLGGALNEMWQKPNVTLRDISRIHVMPLPTSSIYESPQKKKIKEIDAAFEETQGIIKKLEIEPLKNLHNLFYTSSRTSAVLHRADNDALFHANYCVFTSRRDPTVSTALLVAVLAFKALSVELRESHRSAVQCQIVAHILLAAGCALLFRQNSTWPEEGEALRIQSYARYCGIVAQHVESKIADAAHNVPLAHHSILAALEVLLERGSRRIYTNGPQMVKFANVFQLDKILLQGLKKTIRDNLDEFWPGDFVKLSSQEVGVVVHQRRAGREPIVVRLLDSLGMPMSQPLLAHARSDEYMALTLVKDVEIRAHFDLAQILERASRVFAIVN